MSEKPTTQPKTPTLAQLRKLAKRKGYEVEVRTEWGKTTRIELWKSFDLSAEFRKPMSRARRMAFAVLSALPGKKGQR